jgi:hypothetical protein
VQSLSDFIVAGTPVLVRVSSSVALAPPRCSMLVTSGVPTVVSTPQSVTSDNRSVVCTVTATTAGDFTVQVPAEWLPTGATHFSSHVLCVWLSCLVCSLAWVFFFFSRVVCVSVSCLAGLWL